MTEDTVTAGVPATGRDRYFEHVGEQRGALAEAGPVCLYLETTNRCNLLCTTCPRTFEELEPAADMSWELFTSIVDQFPRIARVVLHGVGEPMMVRSLPRMIRYLKERGVYVLFNTNGTLLTRRAGEQLIDAALDELRISLDAAAPASFALVRGRDLFALTGLKETIAELPAFVRLAHDIGVREVYLQRLVYFPEGQGLARPESALFEQVNASEEAYIREAETLASSLGIAFNASGATEPGTSLRQQRNERPWSPCRRPWTLMYFTAHGKALPCCIAPFSLRGYESFTLGDATQQSLREIWNGSRYQEFRRALLSAQPPAACARCGLRWSL
jgi:MoaA/NifB/PqqE/SkfB family radical SAM enzyme